MNKDFETLRKEYKDLPIPIELDVIVSEALQKKPKKKRLFFLPSTITAAAVILVALVNFSPDAAHAMSKIPVLKEIVEVITFNEFKEEKNNKSIDVKTPAFTGLENKTLEVSLNEKYLEESKKMYEEFTDASENGHFAIDSDYKVVTETNDLLSVRRSIVTTQASAYEQNRYVTLDKENQVVITLKAIFKNDQYVNIISENIKEQMMQQMKSYPNKSYFIMEEEVEPFTQIDPGQQFYITEDHKLVISFDEYEVAPGYMGAVEFEIPTEAISDLLVGDRYIH